MARAETWGTVKRAANAEKKAIFRKNGEWVSNPLTIGASRQEKALMSPYMNLTES